MGREVKGSKEGVSPFALRLTWIYNAPNPSKVDDVASPQLQPI